jgi:hypothetical protein
MTLPSGFPPSAGPARDSAIAGFARSGDLEVVWAPINVSVGEHTATFRVCQDGVKLGGVRLAGSAALAQEVADILQCSLGTPRLLDESWLQATVQVPPAIITPNSSDTSAMVTHSEKIDGYAGGSGALTMPIGKPWVLSRAATEARAALYGWQSAVAISGVPLYNSPATPGVRVVQPLSTAHAPDYVDYSSSLWFVSRDCTVDGADRDLWDILKDPTLALLCSHEGALVNVRQP